MALDFNQRSFTRTADQGVIDEGLRAYMLKVYNYMTTGLLITGLIAYFFGKASIEDVKELKEEGIETSTIPWIEDKEN